MVLSKTEQEIREGKLRKDLLKTLQNNKQGNVVDDIINLIKKDYILLVREPLYCRDCFSCRDNSNGGRWLVYPTFYCTHYDHPINYGDEANNCLYYLNGSEEARKSTARVFGNMEKNLFYK